MSSKFFTNLHRLAVKLKQDQLYSKRPDINMLKDVISEVNHVPLPNIPDTPHVLLPPAEYALIRNNFQIYSEEISNMANNQDKDRNVTRINQDLAGRTHSSIGIKRKNRDSGNESVLNRKRVRINEQSLGDIDNDGDNDNEAYDEDRFRERGNKEDEEQEEIEASEEHDRTNQYNDNESGMNDLDDNYGMFL